MPQAIETAHQPIVIGNIQLANRVVLAPMSGVTDLPFRRLVARLGAGLVVSEMTACAALARGKQNALLRMEGEGVGTHVVQIAGCEPYWMAEGARMAEAAGAAIIDINMGCPARHVTNGASGSALMRDLDHAMTLIEATIGAVSVPVTLKMRLGWDHSSLNAPELARRAEAAGVRLVTVHGRTRCQFYKGEADWSAAPRRDGRGFPARSRAISPAQIKNRRPNSTSNCRWSMRCTKRCWRITACGSAPSTHASISAGRWMPRRKPPASMTTGCGMRAIMFSPPKSRSRRGSGLPMRFPPSGVPRDAPPGIA